MKHFIISLKISELYKELSTLEIRKVLSSSTRKSTKPSLPKINSIMPNLKWNFSILIMKLSIWENRQKENNSMTIHSQQHLVRVNIVLKQPLIHLPKHSISHLWNLINRDKFKKCAKILTALLRTSNGERMRARGTSGCAWLSSRVSRSLWLWWDFCKELH